MALPQDISPLNPALMDTLVRADDADWIPTDDEGQAFMKLLWTGAESGNWAAVFRWKAGYKALPHKHLSGAHTYVLSGRLQIRDDELKAGDYIYERNGMIHDETLAVEDTDYLFISDGPVILFDDNGFTNYLGWEEFERLKIAHEKTKAS